MQHPKSRRMRFLWVVITTAILQSCGASYHLKRAIAKDPTIANDTIVQFDTTIVTNERKIIDTLLVHDTIVKEIQSGGVVVRFQRIHDTIVVDATCLPDTIELTEMIQVERLIYKEQTSSAYKKARNILFLLIWILVILFFIRLVK